MRAVGQVEGGSVPINFPWRPFVCFFVCFCSLQGWDWNLGALSMQGKYSTTGLHTQPLI